MSALGLPEEEFARMLLVGVGVLVASTAVAEPVAIAGARAGRSRRRAQSAHNLHQRLRSWWTVWLLTAGALAIGTPAVVALFATLSFLALREFITLAPTERGDHWPLLLAFFVVGPAQFAVAAAGSPEWLLALVPIYALVVLAGFGALRSPLDRYLERTATIQWSLMSCVVGMSCVPALLGLRSGGDERTLVLLLLSVVVAADMTRVLLARPVGRRLVNRAVSGSRTWEGGIGGVLVGAVVAAVAAPATTLDRWEAVGVAVLTLMAGFGGGFALAAIRSERAGILARRRAEGAHVEVTGAVLSNLGSLLFAAPVFFHLAWYLTG